MSICFVTVCWTTQWRHVLMMHTSYPSNIFTKVRQWGPQGRRLHGNTHWLLHWIWSLWTAQREESEPRFPLVQSGKIRERILGDEIIGGQCLRRQLTPGAHSINTDCCPFPPGSPSSSPPCEWGLHLAFKPNSSWSHWTKGITSYPHTELKTTRSSCSNMYASRGCK